MITVLLVGEEFRELHPVLDELEGKGKATIQRVASIQEGIEREKGVEVILVSDPLTDGTAREAVRDLRSWGRGIPLVVLASSEGAAREAWATGADAVLGPQDLPHLAEKLPNLLSNLAQRWAREERCRQDNRIMKAILDTSPLAMCVIDQHVIIWMNTLMARMLGYGEHELLGTDPLLLIPDEEEHQRIDAGLFGTPSQGGWGSVDGHLKRKDGTILTCHLQARPIDPADPSQGHVVIGQDITEYTRMKELLRKNEMRYQNMIDTARSIILRIGTDGTIRFINRFGEMFFGYASEELVGKNVVGTILPRKSRAGRDLASMVQDVMQNPEEYEVNVNENMKKNGERIWIAWTNRAIRDEEGTLVEILSIGTDITDRQVDVRDLELGTAPWKRQLLEGTDIQEQVFDAAYEIALEISREGREGKPIGTTFLLGDAERVLARSRQLILNPFEGHPAPTRCITSDDLRETIKELAQLDGAFVVCGNGLMEAAGRYITIDTSETPLPRGLGTRHASVAGITQETKAVGIVVSQSGGRISIFRDGRIARVITLNEL